MPLTYGRRAAKRANSSTVEQASTRQNTYERPAKRAKVVVHLSPVSTDGEDAEEDRHRNGRKSISDTTVRDLNRALHSTRPVTPPADIHQSSKPSRTYLSRTSNKSQVSLDDYESSLKKPVKNLSELFNFGSASRSKSTAQSPEAAGIAKRMLSRSRTQSFPGPQERSTSRGDIAAHTSSESTAFSSSKSSTPTKISKSHSSDNMYSPSKPRNAALRTYAGPSRSFLVSLPVTQSSADSRPHDNIEALFGNQDDLETHETYSDLRARWGVDNSEDDPYPLLLDSRDPVIKQKRKARGVVPSSASISNIAPIEVKSITELRNKGESRRFQDEVGYLFEGLDSEANVSVRRGSALEIIAKFSNLDFARKAKISDFTVQAWQALCDADAGHGDKVLDSVLVVFAVFVAQDHLDLVDLANRSNCVDILFKMLDLLSAKNDVLGLVNNDVGDMELKKAGITRTEKSTLVQLDKILRKRPGIVNGGTMVSSRLLITRVLVSIPSSFYRTDHVPILLECLMSEITMIPPRVSGYATGLSLLPPPSPTRYLVTPSFGHIENCLRLLEAYLLGRWDKADSESDVSSTLLDDKREDLVQGLVACCIATDILMRDSVGNTTSILAQKCQESALRVLINFSHDNEPWCQTLLQDECTLPMITRLIVIAHKQRCEVSGITTQERDCEGESATEDWKVHAFDRLCLALGLFTNLVQVNEAAKDLSRETMFDPSCPSKRSCVRACKCPQRISTLECLIRIYLHHHKASEDETDSIVRGYVAILFGLLLRDNISNQRILLAALPGSTNRTKLRPIIESAREFIDLYGEVMMRVAGIDAQDESNDTQDIPDGIGAGKKQNIALDVVAFLEVLSDSPDT